MKKLPFLPTNGGGGGEQLMFRELSALLKKHSILKYPKDIELMKWKTSEDMLEWIRKTKEEPVNYKEKFNFATSHFLKGIPRWELFATTTTNDELPPNLTLYNYRKPKWSTKDYDSFLQKSLSNFNKYME